MGVVEFSSALADITLDLGHIGEAFGRWGIEKYREWNLCCDALALQWVAVQNFLALKGSNDRFSDQTLKEILRCYNRFLDDYVIPGGIDPEMKEQALVRIKNQRSQYDKLITAGKNRSFLGADYQTDIGATFAFLSGFMGAFKIRKLGTELYRFTLDLCMQILGQVRVTGTAHPKDTPSVSHPG